MSGINTLKLNRRSQPRWMLWIIVVFPFLFGLLNEVLNLPWAIRYLLDVAWGLLVVYLVRSKGKGPSLLVGWILLFGVYTLAVYVVQFQSPSYYLWGFRNNFRFYAVFLSMAAFGHQEDIVDAWNLFDKLFWLNILASSYQFFVLGLSGDHLGGLFSTEAGGNGYTNMFFLIVTTKSVVFCLDKREKLSSCMLRCGTALVVAAMAELKFFFVEFLLVVSMALVLTKFTWRKFAIVAGSIGAVALGLWLLEMQFPESMGWFSVKRILDSALSKDGYTAAGDLNRLNAIPRINDLWLKNGWLRMFGLGLGNCDTAQFAFLNTPFYERYGHMHYLWRSYAAVYLEMGWMGLLFYWGFFLLVFVGASKIEKRSNDLVKSYCKISKIIAVMCVLISLYNASLRTEAGFIAYVVMAMPFGMARKDRGKM